MLRGHALRGPDELHRAPPDQTPLDADRWRVDPEA